MTLVHLLQYRLHHSKLTDIDIKNTDYWSDYQCITSIIHMYTSTRNIILYMCLFIYILKSRRVDRGLITFMLVSSKLLHVHVHVYSPEFPLSILL